MSNDKRRVLVYVQALPIAASPSGEGTSKAKSFVEYFQNSSEFVLTHSSKIAISKALLLGTMDVTAIGYAPVLHEAMTRGTSSVISTPLCDSPYEQARAFPQGNFEIIVGENPDGIFSGASLAGALVALRGCTFRIWDNEKEANPEYFENNVVLVKDLLLRTPGIDIRRIRRASEEKFDAQAVQGNSKVLSDSSASNRHEIITGAPKDLSSALTKRLRRNIPTANTL